VPTLYRDDDGHLYLHAEGCLYTEMMTNISYSHAEGSVYRDSDEHLYSHAELHPCTEMMASISIHM